MIALPAATVAAGDFTQMEDRWPFAVVVATAKQVRIVDACILSVYERDCFYVCVGQVLSLIGPRERGYIYTLQTKKHT